jgi:hypothetical protein
VSAPKAQRIAGGGVSRSEIPIAAATDFFMIGT